MREGGEKREKMRRGEMKLKYILHKYNKSVINGFRPYNAIKSLSFASLRIYRKKLKETNKKRFARVTKKLFFLLFIFLFFFLLLAFMGTLCTHQPTNYIHLFFTRKDFFLLKIFCWWWWWLLRRWSFLSTSKSF